MKVEKLHLLLVDQNVVQWTIFLSYFASLIGDFDQTLCLRLFEEISLFNFAPFLRKTHKAE